MDNKADGFWGVQNKNGGFGKQQASGSKQSSNEDTDLFSDAELESLLDGCDESDKQ